VVSALKLEYPGAVSKPGSSTQC